MSKRATKNANGAITVESGIPAPASRTKYPWDAMKVGESFFVPGKSTNQLGGLLTARARADGRKYTSRTVDGGTRVWRIA